MDVIDGRSNDGNRALVSVRGKPSEFVSELLILVDGHSVVDPFMSGVYWNRLPVQIQDIERIEIVRGPNAALYGSNAVSGVINIITKKPEGKAGFSSEEYGGSGHTVDASNAFELGNKNWGVRGSHTYFAEDGNLTAAGLTGANDFWQSNKANTRAFWKNDKTDVDASVGLSWNYNGIPGYASDTTQTHTRDDIEMIHVTHHLNESNDVELRLSRGANSWTGGPFVIEPTINVREYNYEGEVLDRMSLLDGRSQTTYGMSWNYWNSRTGEVYISPTEYQRVSRGFLHESFKLAQPLTLVAGVSLENSHTGGTEPAWQASAIVTPHENHTVRFSYAVASTLPSLADTYANYSLMTESFSPLLPSALVTLAGNGSIMPQTSYNYEVGYLGKYLDNRVNAEAVLFYTYMRDMLYATSRVAQYLPSPPYPAGVPSVIDIGFDNSNRSITRGAELRLTAHPYSWLTAYANYAYTSVTVAKRTSVVDGGSRLDKNAPEHTFNIGGTADLGHGFSVTPNLGYKDNYEIGSISRSVMADIPRSFRMDLRVAYKVTKNVEAFVAGTNLFQPYQVEYVDTTAIPRAFYGGLHVKL